MTRPTMISGMAERYLLHIIRDIDKRKVNDMFKNRRYAVFASIGIIVVIFAMIVPFASQEPDGFDRAAEELSEGVEDNAGAETSTPFAGYEVEGVQGRVTGNWIAGTAGILTVFILGIGMGRLLTRRKSGDAS